eukprot:GHVL01043663.1.p1 GENE.GHVL01043663.1~~GHVL01043663.1.p1  ORF type:complete len:344 (+),score=87.63 GHVL01043663.1:156-1034(+)
MYQSVGSEVVEYIADSMKLPLYCRRITGTPKSIDSLSYSPRGGDEVEDLFEILKTVQEFHPSVTAVSCGAILSNYQKFRVENVCERLKLTPVAYLWERDGVELLSEMLDSGLEAVVVKTASLGLNQKHIGRSLRELKPHLIHLNERYDCHPCGEGGEYETVVVDSPLFTKLIKLDDEEIIIHSEDDLAPVLIAKYKNISFFQKDLKKKSNQTLDNLDFYCKDLDFNLINVLLKETFEIPTILSEPVTEELKFRICSPLEQLKDETVIRLDICVPETVNETVNPMEICQAHDW